MFKKGLMILVALLFMVSLQSPSNIAAECTTMDLSTAMQGNYEDTEQETADTIETDGVCGDYPGECPIRMSDHVVIEQGENDTRTTARFTMNYACCDDATDCVYKGRCYDLGSPIDANPRYACGSSNQLIEALDADYLTTDDVYEQASVEDIDNAYSVQEVPIVNPFLISCNSKNQGLPQLWKTIDECSTGTLEFRITDGPSGNVFVDDVASVQLELFKLGGLPTTEYTNYTLNISDRGVYTIQGLLGTYYNVLVMVAGGNIGSLSNVRVNYDEDDPERYTIETYRDNTCYGCVDLSLGNGLCNMECEGRGFGNLCSYPNDEIMEKCHLRAPGNEVLLDNGTVVECCTKVTYEKIEDLDVEISCEYGNLVRKEHTLQWKGKPIKLVVTSCGE
jgi:hypothetical protein